MPTSTDRHRPGYHADRENQDKQIRKAAKVVQWDELAEERAKAEREPWRYDLRDFLKAVMPNAFHYEFSQAHDEMIAKVQGVILQGGKSADALPRGSGKTTILTGAFIWAVLYGHRRYGAIIGNEADAAKNILESVKTEIWLSEHIGKYWPKLRAYIERGDGQSQKYRHLLNSDKSPPLIKWSTDLVRLPSTPKEEGDEWSGAILNACGITGRIRGMFIKMDDGAVLRPDFVLIDDPQTRESSKSVTQINDRENTITGDIGGLGGPGKSVATFMAMTVIYPNDLACRFLDDAKHPSWNARKVPMLIKWPDVKDTLWQEYNMIRVAEMREMKAAKKVGFPEKSTAYYKKNREAMDAGAEVYWEERKFPEDVSALQHAMNLWFNDPTTFLAEFQNEPVQYTGGAPYVIEEMDVMTSTNSRKRLDVPKDAQIIVSFTDINYSGLNTVVLASTNDAVAYIIDYQTFPGNGQMLYDAKNTMKSTQSDKRAIAQALDRHIPMIASARYSRDGKAVSPDLVLIDCGYHMDLVFRWCEANRDKVPRGMLYPSRGRAYNKYRASGVVGKPGDNFHVADWEKRGRVLVHNSDEWRMRTQKGFLMPSATSGSISLFGSTPHEHKRIADEICAEVLEEYIELTEGGNQFFKWGHKPGVSNDLLDAVVGAKVGTVYLGASEAGMGANPTRKRKPKPKRRIRHIKI